MYAERIVHIRDDLPGKSIYVSHYIFDDKGIGCVQ